MKVLTRLHLLACCLLIATCGAYAKEKPSNTFAHAFMDQEVCEAMIACHRLFPQHAWSTASEVLMKDILDNGNVASHDLVATVVRECLELVPHDVCLKTYKNCLDKGEAVVEIPDNETEFYATRKGCKKYCRLCVGTLTVTGNAVINGNLTVTGSITAASFNLAYGYVYNTGAQTVASLAAVAFSSSGPSLDATVGTGGITVTNAGTYSITYSVSGAGPEQFEIYVNGVASPSTLYGSPSVAAVPLTGVAVVTLPAGAVVTLVNVSATPITLAATSGGTNANVNASLLVTQLS